MIGDEIEVVDIETRKLGRDEGLAKKKGIWIRIKRLSGCLSLGHRSILRSEGGRFRKP